MVLLARDGVPSGRMCQCAQADEWSRLCSMASDAPAPWCPTVGPSRRSQRRAWSLHLRCDWFCSSATARRRTCLCQCAQADDGSRLCSMANGAPAPWRPTAGPSRRSQRRARSLHLRRFEFRTTAREESVQKWVCSPATVCRRAACDSVRKRTNGAACAPQPRVVGANRSGRKTAKTKMHCRSSS